jgi:hypothetical protein
MKKYLEDFHRMKLFRLEDVVQIVGNKKSAKDLLRNYKKQQLICQIRRDLYTVTDLATKQAIATKFEIGSNITPLSLCIASFSFRISWIGSPAIFYPLHFLCTKIYSIRFRRHSLFLLQIDKRKRGLYTANEFAGACNR